MQGTRQRVVESRDYFEGSSPGLLAALSEAMHSMAQPLTVLRATLEIAAGNASSISQYQHAIDSSLTEIARVAETMGFIQELVRIARDSPTPMPFEVRPVLATVREDLECVLEHAGISLNIRVAEDVPTALGSTTGLRQCLFYLVQHAQSVAVTGDAIAASASCADGEVQLAVRHLGVASDSLASSEPNSTSFSAESRFMALAEAVAAAQQVRLQWQANPFVARLSLPAVDCLSARRQNSGHVG